MAEDAIEKVSAKREATRDKWQPERLKRGEVNLWRQEKKRREDQKGDERELTG